MNRFYFLLVLFCLAAIQLAAQPGYRFTLSNSLLGSSSETLPFWLWANQDGKTDPSVSFLNLTTLGTDAGWMVDTQKDFRIKAGAELVGGLERESYFQLNRLFAGVTLKGWQIDAGLFYDSLRYYGLSTTNGNLARSRNARPYPKIRLSTTGFKPVPWLGRWLAFSAEYDEGVLNDERYVTRTRLHHKSFYLQTRSAEGLTFQAGLEHWVMWGGTSADETVGKLPDDFSAYLRYITTAPGDEGFLDTDQRNVAGNQFGTWQILVSKTFENFVAEINISHPFEDYSGVSWRNWPDNLIGLSIRRKSQDKGLTQILYEYTDTRNQSVFGPLVRWNEEKQDWERQEPDSYFNHGIYRSGATYYGKAFVSPLIAPVITVDGTSRGFGSNRLFSHHLGARGKMSESLAWKSLLTWSKYFGRWGNPYDPAKKQFSGLFQMNYNNHKWPFELGLSLAADWGTFYKNTGGVQLTISRTW